MKKIDDVVVDIGTKIKFNYRPPFSQEKEEHFTEMEYKIINKLFKTFVIIFPAFKQSWPTPGDFDSAKREWMKAFRLAKLNDVTTIKKGVDKYRLVPTPFVPSPGQFIAMCGITTDEERSKVPYYAKSALESDEIKDKRKKDARRHLDGLYKKLYE